MSKSSALSVGLKAAAGHQPSRAIGVEAAGPIAVASSRKAMGTSTVLIGGHYSKEVRRTLLLVQADPENTGKNLKMLLGEAINDLCAKYGKPQPYTGEI